MKTLVFLCLLAFNSCAQSATNSKTFAYDGYDLVSYFEGKAEKGLAQFELNRSGQKYRFASKKHLDLFSKNPDQYLPQYGGWCAYAMGLDGSKVEINPESYKVLNGKLYLFYKTKFVDTKSKWDKNEAILKKKADENWSKTK